MKKILLYFFVALTLVSCSDMLDVEPTQSISSDQAISNKKGVERAITGTYDALQQTGLFGRNAVVVADLAADNLQWTGTTLDYGQIASHTIPANNAVIEGMWASAYDAINRANNVLARLPRIGDMTAAEKLHAEAECRFLRGLLHFELTRWWGDIPLRLEPTVGLENINAPRVSRAEVMTSVMADLEFAGSNLDQTTSTAVASAFAAHALRARAALYAYHYTGNKAMLLQAQAEAALVIAGGYTLVADFDLLFNADANTESLFEIAFSAIDRNVIAQYFYPRSLTGRYEFGPSAGLIAGFEPGDSRAPSTVALDPANVPYGYKYRDITSGSDRVYVIRLAEMYTLLAEAALLNDNNLAGAAGYLNELRSRAGLAPLDASGMTAAQMAQAIEDECRREFALEGHRWHDLVRTGRAADVLGIEAFRTLLPIPLSEIQTNTSMIQNPGY